MRIDLEMGCCYEKVRRSAMLGFAVLALGRRGEVSEGACPIPNRFSPHGNPDGERECPAMPEEKTKCH